MKKIKLLYAVIGILFLSTIFGISKVNAEEYTGQAIWPSEFISNIYIKKYKPDGYMKYQQARFLRRSEDNKFVYCLQPYVEIDNNLPYYQVARSDYATYLNMTQEQWDRVSLLAYYGYQYNENGYDHSNNKWYAITQVLIWRTVEPTSRIVFTDTLNGTEVSNKFASEIAEIESLVANHYKKPSFNTEIKVPIGKSQELVDSNGVLSNFKVVSVENGTASINGNTLTITPTSVGQVKVKLAKNTTKYSTNPIVYFSNHSQNVMRVGNYDPVPASVEITSVGGRVKLYKVDSDTKNNYAQGGATLKGAVYGIYNLANEKVGEITTDESGYGISDYLPDLGEFTVKEITASKGYTLDKNKYTITIDSNNLIYELEVYEKVIESNIKLFKTFASGSTGILKGEANIDFEIYLNNCNKNLARTGNSCYVDTITTDNKGYAYVKLPYGTYTFKQTTSTPNYEKIEDFEVVVDESSESDIYKLISNAPITAKLKVIKVDKETGEVITKAGIKFKIKDTSTNEYVCQTITYPTASKVCVFETDKNGVIITPSTLVGDFLLEEVEDQVVEGYVWNSEKLNIHIGDGSEIVIDENYGALLTVEFTNERVKGQVDIIKYGEDFIIKDGTFSYEKTLIDNVKLGLYANEDIYIGNKKIYSKDDLVKEVITKDGKVSIKDLELGKYYIKEIATLNDYVLDTTKYSFELTYKDQYTKVIMKDITIDNFYKKGTIEITKKDLVNDEVIPNTTLEVYTEDDKLIFTGKTNEDGKIIIDNLKVGKYYILEKEASTGYVITDEKVYFEILDNGEIVKAEMKNKPITGTVEITKIDISTGEVLPNTLIEVYTESDELIFSGRTDETGKITIENLRYGKYYFLEKEAPDGYQINSEKMWFEILEDGEIVKSELADEKIIVEVPNTLKSDYMPYIMLGISVIGLGVVAYGITKKRKNK